MSVQNLGANGAGITTLINIGYVLNSILTVSLCSIPQSRNEPDFATPYLYNYINRQSKSVERSRSLATQ
jgi:putative alpha-1,2-mannosidase